jgi:hypothetical protein
MITGTLEAVSNCETWTDTIEFIDDETGEPFFDYSDSATHPSEITLKLRDQYSGNTVLSISMTGGDIVLADDGIAEFTVDADSMAAIAAKTYTVGILYTFDDITKQLILGSLPVLEGL